MRFTECFVIETNCEEPFPIGWSWRNVYAVTGRLRTIQSWEEPRTVFYSIIFSGLLPLSRDPETQPWRWGLSHPVPHLNVCCTSRGIEAWIVFYSHLPCTSPHCSPNAHTNTHTTFFLNYLKVTDILHFSHTKFSMYHLRKWTFSYIPTVQFLNLDSWILILLILLSNIGP